ncbi:hypothetical protein [Phycicoccus flavus]|uniref:hypothetical protein n=1 Tax=Phycicoccus flavus TaxID=2502783 RepID=UPI000FEC162E|nr:hypothetical protein [Phycicoccus flavus]NHA70143.1 hypothetical protein [Phycicoccus flavus]
MHEHRAWVRRAMARTALTATLAAVATVAVLHPAWVARVVGTEQDGPSVSWVILVAAWGAVLAGVGAVLAWSRAADVR